MKKSLMSLAVLSLSAGLLTAAPVLPAPVASLTRPMRQRSADRACGHPFGVSARCARRGRKRFVPGYARRA